jgi:hypothetical protein
VKRIEWRQHMVETEKSNMKISGAFGF